MKISILLPYKENFSPVYPGAVSLFVNDTFTLSKFKKYITIYGNTKFKQLFSSKYKNIPLSNFRLGSLSKKYLRFINEQKIHLMNYNRQITYELIKFKNNYFLYFQRSIDNEWL